MSATSRSPLALAALATVAVPGLSAVSTARSAQSDADFDVAILYDDAGTRWIVRSPRGAAAGAGQEAEISLLRAITDLTGATRLPFDVPEPAGTAPLPEGGRAVVYRDLPGMPLDLAQLEAGSALAADLGRAIAALHELPTYVVEIAGLPAYDTESYRRRHLAEIDEAALTGVVPTPLLERWEKALENSAAWRFRPCVLHGDLAAEHILTDGERITGILDFAQARVADPADDLAWLLLAVEPDVLDTIERAYSSRRTGPPDPDLIERAGLLGELALVRWLLYGVRTNDQEIIADAVGMLDDLAAALAAEEQAARDEEERARRLAEQVAQRAAEAAERAAQYADEHADDRGERRTPRRGRVAGASQTAAVPTQYDTEPLSLNDLPTQEHDLSAALAAAEADPDDEADRPRAYPPSPEA